MMPPFRALALATCLTLPFAPALVPPPASAQAMFGPLGTGVVPNSMTHDDLDALAAAGARLYNPEHVDVGMTENWDNPQTGNRGSVKMIKEFTQKGMLCRRLEHRITLKREGERKYVMNRCKGPDGQWKLAG
jgi:surface antigen